MSEHDPTKREHIGFSPIERFDADMMHLDEFDKAYTSFTRYLTEEFPIPEAVVDRLCWSKRHILPISDAFEKDPSLGREKFRIALMRIALPLAEGLIESDKDFTVWTERTAKAAMNFSGRLHRIADCIEAPPAINGQSCASSLECPIRITKQLLITDALQVDFDSPDYSPDWSESKIERTLSKLAVALQLGLTIENETDALGRSYVNRCRVRNLPLPKAEDN